MGTDGADSTSITCHAKLTYSLRLVEAPRVFERQVRSRVWSSRTAVGASTGEQDRATQSARTGRLLRAGI
jgi:hypothetical protein